MNEHTLLDAVRELDKINNVGNSSEREKQLKADREGAQVLRSSTPSSKQIQLIALLWKQNSSLVRLPRGIFCHDAFKDDGVDPAI